MVLQRIDEQGGAILQLTHPTDSPVLLCLQQIARHLLEPRDGPLNVALHYYLARSIDMAVVCMKVLVRFSLGFAGRIWRLHRVWIWFPYMLAGLIAADASEEEKKNHRRVIVLSSCLLPRCCFLAEGATVGGLARQFVAEQRTSCSHPLMGRAW